VLGKKKEYLAQRMLGKQCEMHAVCQKNNVCGRKRSGEKRIPGTICGGEVLRDGCGACRAKVSAKMSGCGAKMFEEKKKEYMA